MRTVRVCIATTAGPVMVQEIVAEEPDLHSVVCLNRTTEVLPISRAYDAFVRSPSGVIERRFGNRVYRLDVDAPIEAGRSWQLGVSIAHWLAAVGRLAKPDDDAALTVWATGEVDRSLTVGAAGHLPEKLAASRALFERWAAESRKVVVLLPLPGGADLNRDLREVLRHAAVHSVATVDDAERAVEIALGDAAPMAEIAVVPTATSASASATSAMVPRRGARWIAMAAAIIILGVAMGGTLQAGLVRWLSDARAGRFVELDAALDEAEGAGAGCLFCRPALALYDTALGGFHAASARDIEIHAVTAERRRFERCEGVDEGRRVPLQHGGAFPDMRLADVCLVEYHLRNAAAAPRAVVAAATLAVEGSRGDRTIRSRILGPGDILVLRLPLEDWTEASLAVRLRIVVGPPALLSDEGWIAASVQGVDWRNRLGRLGLATIDATNRLQSAARIGRE